MKQLSFSLLLLFCVQAIQAQIATIGDPNLKTELIADGVDTNGDGEIQVTEALAVTNLNISGNQTRTFEGIDQFTNLTNLTIGSSSYPFDEYTNLDLRKLTNLEVLNCSSGINGEVNVSDLNNLKILNAGVATFGNISKFNLTGLASLEEFSYAPASGGGFTNPYFNQLTNLKKLEISSNSLSFLEIGNLTNLEWLSCANNQLTSLDLSNMSNLTVFSCTQNQLTSLDLSNNNITGSLSFAYNPITSLNIKDGNAITIQSYSLEATNIQNVCCDASELTDIQNSFTNAGYTGVTFETNCAPTPSTPYYTIQGKNTLDSNLNGCDAGDDFLPTVEYTISNGTDDVIIYTDKFGNYEFVGKAGTYTITPSIPNTNYYSISPASITVNFPADGTTVIQDFCVTPNGAPIVTSLSTRLKNDILAQTNVDTNGDGEIQITEAESVTSLTVISPIIKGLDDFINIETLNCNGSSIFANPYNTVFVLYLDVSPLVNLKNLYASRNRIATLDVSQNTNLERLDCRGNLLNSLLLTNNPNLTYLSCGNFTANPIIPPGAYSEVNRNTFKILDLSTNTLLESVNCSYATMEGIVFGSNTNLETIYCINNGLTSLDISQLPNLKTLHCFTNDGTSSYIPNSEPNQLAALNVSQNVNLENLNCSNNLLTSIDVSQNSNLLYFDCSNNPLNSFDISQNTGLKTLGCANVGLTILDLSLFPDLYSVNCADNQLTTLDISQNPILQYLTCQNNQITQLFVKNGNNFETTVTDYYASYHFRYSGNPLEYICADEFEIEEILNYMPSNLSVAVNTYCSFVPGGSYNTIEGTVRFDANANGCDINDNPYEYLNLNLTNSTNETTTIATQNDGSYSFHFSDDGVYTLTPILENPLYFTVSPASITVNFPTDASPFTQNFCITPNVVANDVDITLIPLNQARPGFDSNYKIVYKNKGNTTITGAIQLTFEDDVMDLVMSNPTVTTQAVNSLLWNYANLLPFETREIFFTMNLNTPTDASFPLNSDDVLDFEATITPIVADETMDDNTNTLSQTVVNSFDPNDKTCLQGTEITTDLVGEYVDYMIRFENTGTANAINVVVKDVINTTMFDPSTLIVTNAIHAVTTRFTNANTVEFIFENINLPFDDASNDGFVTFKIKTLPTLAINDTFENEAEIFFDYNFPIETNKAITLVEDTLNTPNFELDDFEMYPNPVKDMLIIKTKEAIETIKIYDISGRLIRQTAYTATQNTIEITTAKFTTGTYFINIKTVSNATLVKKMIKM
ncbi:T9SS type A sorting domain-containing protein [Kordia jejudonensis]|uniref:T9SS type A sorting domain-containing protein n=1 Tax=Kordia jejudonensis TaxID=1348245 RepID=UPI00069BC42A|nr:T9SS type A sorting domain-containing protein [Kordia jejudonensis]